MAGITPPERLTLPLPATAVTWPPQPFVAPFGEGGLQPELFAELRLSAREAYDGVTVPLDVPVRKLCLACGGRGEV